MTSVKGPWRSGLSAVCCRVCRYIRQQKHSTGRASSLRTTQSSSFAEFITFWRILSQNNRDESYEFLMHLGTHWNIKRIQYTSSVLAKVTFLPHRPEQDICLPPRWRHRNTERHLAALLIDLHLFSSVGSRSRKKKSPHESNGRDRPDTQ